MLQSSEDRASIVESSLKSEHSAVAASEVFARLESAVHDLYTGAHHGGADAWRAKMLARGSSDETVSPRAPPAAPPLPPPELYAGVDASEHAQLHQHMGYITDIPSQSDDASADEPHHHAAYFLPPARADFLQPAAVFAPRAPPPPRHAPPQHPSRAAADRGHGAQHGAAQDVQVPRPARQPPPPLSGPPSPLSGPPSASYVQSRLQSAVHDFPPPLSTPLTPQGPSGWEGAPPSLGAVGGRIPGGSDMLEGLQFEGYVGRPISVDSEASSLQYHGFIGRPMSLDSESVASARADALFGGAGMHAQERDGAAGHDEPREYVSTHFQRAYSSDSQVVCDFTARPSRILARVRARTHSR